MPTHESIEILVVEDDLASLDVIKACLESEGYQIIHCHNGQEALTWLREHRSKADLALVDIMMPVMDGMTLIQHLRSPAYNIDLPILLLTGLNHPLGVERGLEAGANDYMTKPFHPVELLARVRNLLRIRKYQQQLQLYNQTVQHDLEIARELQQGLIPISPLLDTNIRLAWIYKPCSYVGGDMVNFFTVNQKLYGFYVADVSGHGVASAMLSTWLYHTLKPALAQTQQPTSATTQFKGLPLASPRSVAVSLDQMLSQKSSSHYLTMCYAIYHAPTRKLNYIRCGHTFPILITAEGECKILTESDSPAIGMSLGLPFEAHSIVLNHGDRVFLYSDALLEASSPKGEAFGLDRFCIELIATAQYQLENQLNSLLHTIQHFQEKDDFNDDFTLLLLEVP